MTLKTGLLCVTLAGILSACATPNGDRGTLNVPLRPGQQNLGAVAQATLVARGEVTDVRIFLSGPLPLGVSRMPQLFAFIYPGFCGSQGSRPAFEMNSTVTAFSEIGGWRLRRTAATPLEALRSGDYSIVVRTSPQDRNIDIFCGDIR
ncbi:MAG: hypothetical protein WBO95_09845 [Candidatus Dechloromonas phosphoritropha]